MSASLFADMYIDYGESPTNHIEYNKSEKTFGEIKPNDMKAYTDLEQSKKLLEILPLESADMMWCFDDIKEEPFIFPYRTNIYEDSKDIPAWSLAALLNIININYYTTLYHDGVAWNIDIIHHDNIKEKYSVYANTPLDTCVEIILKLHEQKIL